MNDRDRLEQLRGLLARLERAPASAERDWMLREVRARAVDIETGEKPSALRALPADDAAAAAAPVPATPKPQPKPRPAPRRPVARRTWNAPAAPALRPSPLVARPLSAVDPLELDGVLCLDDQPAMSDEATTRPWAVGLRG